MQGNVHKKIANILYGSNPDGCDLFLFDSTSAKKFDRQAKMTELITNIVLNDCFIFMQTFF